MQDARSRPHRELGRSLSRERQRSPVGLTQVSKTPVFLREGHPEL